MQKKYHSSLSPVSRLSTTRLEEGPPPSWFRWFDAVELKKLNGRGVPVYFALDNVCFQFPMAFSFFCK